MGESKPTEFGRWRAFLWPVHRFELRKLIPMLLIFFFITFNYNVLRVLKDSLVVTAKSSGAEVIPFIKVWVLFPGAVIMTWLFSYFSSRLKREAVFYTMISLFLGYFLLFLLIYPYHEALQADSLAEQLTLILPPGFKGMIAMVRYWLFTSFYVMSELWGSVVLFVLFWGFANQVTRLGEAKRFYGLFGIGANFSGVFAGQASILCLNHSFNPALPFGTTAWDQSMVFILLMILGSGLMAVLTFRWLNRKVLTDPRFYDSSMSHKETHIKGRISLRDNFRYLLRTPYLLYIAIIVVSYNVVINLVEVLWKHEVRLLLPDPSHYSLYMNQVSSLIGAIATLSALFVSGNAIRLFGWTFTALLTPVILFITSVGFFGFFFLDQMGWEGITLALGSSPLAWVVFFGTLQNVMSRGAKYTVFDATKEMAFVPLSPESKLNGKAAIDGICSRMGKSGGAFIHQSLLLFFVTLSSSAPYVAIVLFGIILIWMMAVRALGREFVALTEPAKEEKPPLATQEVIQA
jgi:AAA family ATP:ADP antiporter